MMTFTLAVTPPDAPGLALRILAIFGGVLLGAFAAGFISRVATKLLTTRSMPLWGVRFMRLLGGVGGGVLVWFFVFGDGSGFGFGGSGGGSGKDKGSDKGPTDEKKDKPPEVKPPKKDDDKGNEKKNVVRVAILGGPLKKLQGTDSPDPKRCYLIEGEQPLEVHDIKSIQNVIREKRKQEADLKVILVLYKDSPEQNHPLAQMLFKYLAGEMLFSTWDQPSNKAPY